VRAVAAVPLFVLGVYLSMRLLAALYRVVDVWYAIDRDWPGVVRGLALWCATTAAVAGLLPPAYRPALFWGLAAYLAFFLALYVVREPIVRAAASRARRLR
jgi:hypothetical protein